MLVVGCSDDKKKEPASGPAPEPVVPDAAPPRHVEPSWIVNLPGVPGVQVLQATGGPVITEGTVAVASSVLGFTAVDWETGKQLWQRPGEEITFDPVATPAGLLLPGRCAHRLAEAPTRGNAVACVDVVDPRSGARRAGHWVLAPEGVAQARPIGVASGNLIWCGNGTVWVDSPGGKPTLIERRSDGDPRCESAALEGDTATVVWRDRITTLRRTDGAFEPTGTHGFAEPAVRGVAGPARAGPLLAAVRDDTLELRGANEPIDLRPAVAPDALAGGDDALRVIALDGGVHPVVIDPETLELDRGTPVPGIQAHDVRWLPDGSAAVSIRVDTSLRRDAAVLFDAAGDPRWIWQVPEPPEPRLDPVTVDADEAGVAVFFDGRQLARLPAP